MAKTPPKGMMPMGNSTMAPAMQPAAKPAYTPPAVAQAPATRPMAPDAGKPNALPKHALHARGRGRGMKGY